LSVEKKEKKNTNRNTGKKSGTLQRECWPEKEEPVKIKFGEAGRVHSAEGKNCRKRDTINSQRPALRSGEKGGTSEPRKKKKNAREGNCRSRKDGGTEAGR